MKIFKEITRKFKTICKLGFSNSWFIVRERRRKKRERVNTMAPSCRERSRILSDGERRKVSFGVLINPEEREGGTMSAAVQQLYRKYCVYKVGRQEGAEYRSEIECWNQIITMCSEDYLVLCGKGVVLAPTALWFLSKKIDETGAVLLYSDEKRAGHEIYKPDFGIDTFLAQNYLGKMLCIERRQLEVSGGLEGDNPEEAFSDIILKVYESKKNIVHIPEVLFCSDGEISYLPVQKEVLKRHLLISKFLEPFDKSVQHPLISIIIPNKDHVEILRQCITSILEKSTYDWYEILVIENNSTKQETFDYYNRLEQETKVRVITCVTDWNYSYINNFGAKEAKGEYLLFLNNDTKVIAADWLEEMLRFAARSDVGAVGAKLFYPDGTIQHGGVILGIRGVAGHAFHGEAGDSPGYMNRLITVQDLSAVTAACMMVPIKVFREMGGFDERYKVAFNDTDLCMRIRKAGYLVVYNPNVELYHYESKSRGQDEESPEKLRRFNQESERFQKQWCRELEGGDPYYNPHLSVQSDNFALAENG